MNVKWEGEEREATLVSLEQEGHAQCARTSFVPKYDAVVSAGVTRGVAVSEVRTWGVIMDYFIYNCCRYGRYASRSSREIPKSAAKWVQLLATEF